MNFKKFFLLFAGLLFLIAPHAWSGHHYKGHGGMMPSWNLSEMDANQDKTLSFEEYRDSQTKQLRAGFDMIDSNSNGVVSEDEWNTFLNLHGVKTE